MTATRQQRREMRRDVRAIRQAGVRVKYVRGWKKRGRSGVYEPRGIMLHHDATAPGESLGVIPLLRDGRADLPGPLCQLWVSRGGTWLDKRRGRTQPTVYVIAAGRANHAGTGAGVPWLGRDGGNSGAIGIEIDLTTGEGLSAEQRRAVTRAVAAICARRGWSAKRVTSHKEYAPGRKSDPDFSMPRLRRRVRRLLRRDRFRRRVTR